ncbi:MAG: hypothetical protein ACFFHV_09955 [Promethearchaeota archaeon]
MRSIRNKKKIKNKGILEISFLSSIIVILFLIQINNISPLLSPNCKVNENQNLTTFNDSLRISADKDILFQGTEEALNITDYGNLYKPNQEVSLTNEEELNFSYDLDTVNNWKISKIENSISNIQDTRNWINNSDIYPITSFRVDYPLVKNYGYNEDENDNLVTIDAPITAGATAMRVHFVNISFQYYLDYIFIEDENFVRYYIDTGFKEDFFSPWIVGDSLRVYIESDNTGPNPGDGYIINYYEFINASSNSQINFYSWGSSNDVDSSVRTTFGSGLMNGSTAFYLGMHGNSFFDATYNTYRTTYYKGDYIEIYQNISIPRGKLIDAYISFDYYPQFAMDAGNNFLYFAINNQEIYSKSLLEIVDLGRNQWHSTGKYNLELWSNTSNVFDNILNDQQLNISFGIKSKSFTTYSYYVDNSQQIFWFDNITLGLTTIANSTQEGINLTINSVNLFDGNQWGYASRDFIDIPQKDPVILTINTTSPSIKFDLNTTLYGYHKSTSKINQEHDEGISYKILENGTIIWEFLHNFYWPPQYSDFEFIIEKPLNWKFHYVKDQGNNLRTFEGGEVGDNYLKINKTEAVFYGWWSFKASSPNYINVTNTKMLKNGQWTHSSFTSGESTKIKTNITYNNKIPPHLNYTLVNLVIYDPQNELWYNNSITPELNGQVIFSLIPFTSKNTLGGVYIYKLLWRNGTALGGISSSFIISHESKLELLKPEEAEDDLRLEAFLGDIIPLRVYLYDDENDLPISGAVVYFEWEDGKKEYLEEASPGVYEATIETNNFKSTGLHKIEIHASKIGFSDSEIVLELELTEETDLLFWIIIGALIIIVSILSVLSLRSYVFIPRKERKEAELIAKTQRYKDLQNIQAVVIIHKSGGVPVYLKSYSILEHQKKELFSGFIQAITTIGEEISGKGTIIADEKEVSKEERILEIDFKHFHCLIADKGIVRTIFILRDKASERLRKHVANFSLDIYSNLKERFDSWDGDLDEFERDIPPILNDHFELYYKEPCILTKPEIIAKIRKDNELNSMELRILNVIYSFLKGRGKNEFYLDYILEVVHEENKDLIIESIETLLNRKIIIPSQDEKYNLI